MYIKNLLSFYSYRNFDFSFFKDKEKRIIYLIYSVSLYYILCFISIGGLKFIDSKIGLPPHKVYSFIKAEEWYVIVLLVLIIGPILEEITFRLFLKFSSFNLCLSFGGIVYYILSIISQTKFYSLEISTLLKFILCSIISFLTYLLMEKKSKQLLQFWNNNQLVIIYISILTFAFLHINNLDSFSAKNIIIFPILILPQLLIAFFASFLRMKCGFNYAIIFHMSSNFIPLLVLLMVKFYS